MPRKKGGLPYEVHPTPAKGKDGKNIMYVKPARGQLYEILGFDSPNNESADKEEYARHVGRISLSRN